MRKIRLYISNNRGGASVYFGVVLMLMSFLVIAICINTFQMYQSDVRAQLICDAIADGSAMAGETPIGFDKIRVYKAADEIFSYNCPDDSYEYQISIDAEYKEGQPTGYQLITVVLKTRKNLFFTSIIDFFRRQDAMAKNYDIVARAVVRAEAFIACRYVSCMALQAALHNGNEFRLHFFIRSL